MSKKILIIGPSWLGDMIMAQIVFKILKQQNESCIIDVLAPEWSRPILDSMPEISQSITMPIGHRVLALRKRFQLANSLSLNQYNRAIILTNTLKSALVPYWAKIPVRTGWLGEWRWGLLNDVRYLNKKRYPKMFQRYAALCYPKDKILPDMLPIPTLTASTKILLDTIDKFNLDIKKNLF